MGQGRGRSGGQKEEPCAALPDVFSIHRARVFEVQPIGFVVNLEGFQPEGLVLCAQVSHNEITSWSDSDEDKVKKLSTVAKVGELVWVKVISTNAGPRIGCSMKYVHKVDGKDLDPGNMKVKPELARVSLNKLQKRKGPVYNVRCKLCKKSGHLEGECDKRVLK